MTLQTRMDRITDRAIQRDRQLSLEDRQQGLGLSTERSHLVLPDPAEKNNASFTVSDGIRKADLSREDDHEFALQTIPDSIDDKFDAVHAANAEAVFLRVTEDGHHEINLDVPSNSYTHTILHVPSGVTATVLLTYNTDEEGFSTEFCDVLVDNDASLHLTEIRRGGNDHVLHTRREAALHADATLHWTQCDTGSELLTNFTKAHLLGDNSEARTTNLYYGADGREYDVSLESHHTGEDTYSFIRSRGALRSAKSTQRGLVRINKPAFDADGYQKADNLLLDDNANAVSIPDLEIHNPEVQCSHGSTVSDLDDEQLFYLNSRGYDDFQAKKVLVEGFFEPHIADVQPERARETLRSLLIEDIQDDLADAS